MKKEAMLWEKIESGPRVHCFLCAHQCRIAESKLGVCGVRQNNGGDLYTLIYGRAIAANVDPIEKKPLFHFQPGSRSFSIATVGCNFKCGFCQNWQISQASREDGGLLSGHELMPAEIVSEAKRFKCSSISYTYTEPTIFFEYAFDTSKLAAEAGLKNVFVTNGYMTREALDTINPYLDAANVDLKSFRDDYYKSTCKARLQPVLDSIRHMKELGIWVEVTTLVVPGGNDSDEELNDIAAFLASLDKDIPWHVSRFHPDYQLLDRAPTPIETLRRARDIGRRNGLRYVYMGNVPEGTDTLCPECGEAAVERQYMGLDRLGLEDGLCAKCRTPVPGVWR